MMQPLPSDFKKAASHSYAELLDRSLQASVGKITGGLSPAALTLAFFDWYSHLLIHPSKQLQLMELMQENYWYLVYECISYLSEGKEDETLLTAQDKRFSDPIWQQFPYRFLYESFLMLQDWWHVATTDVRGVSQHHEEVVDFIIRQLLDMVSPSNSPFTNPEVIKAAVEKSGQNFVKGFENFIDDFKRYQMDEPPAGAENFVIGKNVAVTEGKVIYRNPLIELIQYTPLTKEVYAEPVLITPAWIMKYYILDLTPKHSLVKYLVKRGHTVFMISWKNPTKKDWHFGMEDYLEFGIFEALKVIKAVVPNQKINLVGYCLGGTLTAIAAAALARDSDDRLASMTLFAAQVDFKEPGELGLFIDESQISYLENLMLTKGYLDTHQMAGAFQLLRSNDLIWSRLIRDYLLGERKPLSDLMAWNADGTRLPYRMHSEYLRHLFLNNELSEAKYQVQGRPVALSDIHFPIFVVATERDHVSPWHSVFKINLLTDSDVTFALTSGGHNVGIVSMPSKYAKRHYRLSTLKEDDHYIDADTWYQTTKPLIGSWWPAWEKWLRNVSSAKTTPPPMGNGKAGFGPICDAPGTYVLKK